MNEKRYYWLKLEENYFDLKIQKALRKLPSGSDMLICYLKMQLKYLNTGGIIEYQGICENLAQELAMDIDEEEDLVKMTLSILEKWKVIEPCDSGILIAEMQGRIGSKTDAAVRMEKLRKQQKQLENRNNVTTMFNNVQKCNSIKEIDIEKEKDIEIDNNNSVVGYLEKNFARTISPLEYEKLNTWLETFSEEMVKHAIDLAILNNKKTFSYIAGILKNWKTNGYKTLDEVQDTKKEELPSWFDQEIPAKEITDEERKEFEDLLNSFN